MKFYFMNLYTPGVQFSAFFYRAYARYAFYFFNHAFYVISAPPILPVKAAVVDGFGQMVGLDGLTVFQVGNGT